MQLRWVERDEVTTENGDNISRKVRVLQAGYWEERGGFTNAHGQHVPTMTLIWHDVPVEKEDTAE